VGVGGGFLVCAAKFGDWLLIPGDKRGSTKLCSAILPVRCSFWARKLLGVGISCRSSANTWNFAAENGWSTVSSWRKEISMELDDIEVVSLDSPEALSLLASGAFRDALRAYLAFRGGETAGTQPEPSEPSPDRSKMGG
jgi:hypothetical protein